MRPRDDGVAARCHRKCGCEGRGRVNAVDADVFQGRATCDLVKRFADKGADLNAKGSDGTTPLMHLFKIYSANADLVRFFLENGADVNAVDAQGRTVFMIACDQSSKENIEIAQLLVSEYNADVNVRSNHGCTVLSYLCENECATADFIRLLVVDRGADVNNRDADGDTPLTLLCSAKKPNTELIAVLLENGAEVDARVLKRDRTPLMIVCAAPEPAAEAVHMLLENGADANARDEDGFTPLRILCRREPPTLRPSKSFSSMVWT